MRQEIFITGALISKSTIIRTCDTINLKAIRIKELHGNKNKTQISFSYSKINLTITASIKKLGKLQKKNQVLKLH